MAFAARICASERHVSPVSAPPSQRTAARGLASRGRIEASIARRVVADEAVGDAVQCVALAQHFLADHRDLRRRDPPVARLRLGARQRLADAEVDVGVRRHLREHAVVVLRKALGDDQRFASALRRAEIVAAPDRFGVEARNERDDHVVRLLHLRVGEVGEGFVVRGPVGRGRRRGRRRALRRSDAPSRCRRRRIRGTSAYGAFGGMDSGPQCMPVVSATGITPLLPLPPSCASLRFHDVGRFT